MPRLLRLKEVEDITGLSGETIRRLRKQRRFPEPIVIGVRAIAWPEETIVAHIADRSTGATAPTAA